MEPETAGFEPSSQLLIENKNYEAAALPSEPSLLLSLKTDENTFTETLPEKLVKPIHNKCPIFFVEQHTTKGNISSF